MQRDPNAKPAYPTMFEGLEPRQLLSTYVVDSAGDTSDGNFGAGEFTLREAIEQANANPGADEILFDAGMDGETIRLTRDMGWITDAVSVRGVDTDGAPVSVTINGNGHAGFHLDDGDDTGTIDTPVLLEGLEVRNASASNGGAVYSTEALTLLGMTFESNSATRGAGVYQTGGSLTIINSEFRSGAATFGAGVAVDSAESLTIRGSTFVDNQAGAHAALEVLGTGVAVTIEDSQIHLNTAFTGNGAGVYMEGDHSLQVRASDIRRNSANSGDGGGAYLLGLSDVLILGSVFSYNEASNGAGLYIKDAAGPTKLHNSTVSENFATTDGGGVLFESPNRHLRARNNTIAFNDADTEGGGLMLREGNAPLVSNIIAHNRDSSGDSDIIGESGHVLVDRSTHNLIGSTVAGGLTDGTDGNMVGVDPRIDPLTRFGGMLYTHPLQSDSPAINAGLNPLDLGTDGRSFAAFARTFGGGTDIGSYERQTATFTVTSTDDIENMGEPGDTDISIREAVILSNRNPGVDTIEFAESLHGQTITVGFSSLVLNDSVAVHGPGSELVTIDGNGSRIFEADNGASDYLEITLRGLTLTGGYSDNNGGAVRFEYVYGVLDDMVLHGNTGRNGGGFYQSHGSLTITNSTFSNNSAASSGGAIDVTDISLTITGSTFTGNSGNSLGGAIYLTGPDAAHQITGSVFTQNTANSYGGAIYLEADDATSLTVTGSTFSDNLGRYGGALYNYYDTSILTVRDSTFIGNQSEWSGGAVYSDGPLSISGSTFRDNNSGTDGGSSGYGGAVYSSNDGEAFEITDSVFENNTAKNQGGAVYRSGNGGMNISGSVFRTNTAPDGGGAILHYSGSLTITSSVISGNDSTGNDGYGGGLYVEGGSVEIAYSTISANTGGYGGGIFTDSGVTDVSIAFSSVDNNHTTQSGGGIYTEPGATVSITGSSFSRNHAEREGGGMYISRPDEATIENTTISTNTAGGHGGGIAFHVDTGAVTIANSTIADNHANAGGGNSTAFGGGIMLLNSTSSNLATLRSTIVAGNVFGADRVPDEIHASGTYGFSPAASDFNLIQDAGSAGGVVAGERGNLVGADPLLGALRDNGSGRLTHALPSNSPAVNAGSNPFGAASDQRGLAFTRASGQPDIGAYERQTLALIVSNASDVDDGDYSSGNLTLREAIALSNTNPLNDSIGFDGSLTNSTITIAGPTLLITDDLTITGPGQDALTIDGGGARQIFRIDDKSNGSTLDVEISGLTLTGGRADNGGAIWNAETLTIRDTTISDNQADNDGGGILNRGTLTLSGVTMLNNEAADSGGAIDNDGDTTVTITDSVISRNTAGGSSGAIDHDRGSLAITNSTLAWNTAGGDGGAISTVGTLTLDRVEIFRNTAAGNGGGIFGGSASELDIDRSGVSRNTSGGDGGGIYAGRDLRLINTTVSSNSADGNGGGIEARDARGGLYAVTLAFNTANADRAGGGQGGGLRIGKQDLIGQLELYMTIIAGNTLGNGSPSDIALSNGGAVQSPAYNNLIGDAGSAGGLVDGVEGTIVGRDPRLGPLGWHGGPTRSHQLLSGSPAIDAGVTPQFLTTDQRGEDRGYGLESDIGAFEYQPTNYSLDVIGGGGVAGAATADGAHRFVIRNPAGDLIVFDDESGDWAGYRLRELTGAPKATGEGILWTDPADGLTYVAAPTADGVILYTLDEQGFWTFTNLTEDLRLAADATPASALTQLVTRGGQVIVAGLTGAGDLVAFKQTGATEGGRPVWEFLDISADLAAQGMTTPEFTEMIGYVTAWNAWNFAGIDSAGDIQSVWVHPASFERWRTDNLSDITGAPPLAGQLSVTLTSWSAINLGGVNDAGRLVVTWWVPSFGGRWVTSDLSNAAGGDALQPGLLTGFVTPWGAINYAGLNGGGEVVALWWTPTTGRWASTPLTANLDDAAPRPVGPLSSHVSPAGTMNILGASADDEASRVWWSPTSGGWQLDNLTDLATRT